jgi:hypothetical protein
MPSYFYVHDHHWFHDEFLPALTASLRRRSFAPCLPLCQPLIRTAENYSAQYHVADPPLVCRLNTGVGYDKDLWRLLIGELLIFGAVAMPEIAQAQQTLCCLASPRAWSSDLPAREDFCPMQLAHLGTRELCFGLASYRSDAVGWNDIDDVERLAAYLGGIKPANWQPDALHHCMPDTEEIDRTDELAYATECLTALSGLYRTAATDRRVIVAESM